jgi:RNA polymerase sigma factor (sigma-70 family)
VRTKGGFPATRHSVIERIRDADPDARRQAYGDLVEGYWKPVYKHLRMTWRLDPEDAGDVTQGFFADAFQKAWLERYEPGKARFRTFVRVCADRFVMNRRQSASRLKRGGSVQTLALDFDGAEREVAASRVVSMPEPDEYFHQEFIRALFDKAVQAVRSEYEASGRPTHFALFERYDLAPSEGVSYAQLARDFNLSTTQVTNQLAQVRRRFREQALDTLRGLCGTDAEFRREARELFGVEVE